MNKALIIGAQGTIGRALAAQLQQHYQVLTLSQRDSDYSEDALRHKFTKLKELGAFQAIICCIGSLHNDVLAPEKRLSHLDHDTLAEYFRINTILPALCLRFFHPLLDREMPSRFICLSAMVGSIKDNKSGGWYGYRSSKAALNMMIKTAAIEVARTNKQACLAVVHPGTTQGPLSRPFSANVVPDKYYLPEQSAKRIIELMESLRPEQTGQFFNWDGSRLPW